MQGDAQYDSEQEDSTLQEATQMDWWKSRKKPAREHGARRWNDLTVEEWEQFKKRDGLGLYQKAMIDLIVVQNSQEKVKDVAYQTPGNGDALWLPSLLDHDAVVPADKHIANG